MTLRSRLCAPLTAAFLAAVVCGSLVVGPAGAASGAVSRTGLLSQADPKPDKRDKADSLTASPVRFARSAYLCIGYKACLQAGMSSAGYALSNDSMYWRMYAGHNCTNYAAYRLSLIHI